MSSRDKPTAASSNADLEPEDLYKPPTAAVVKNDAHVHHKLRGLGGWLILVGIGVIMNPLRILKTCIDIYAPIFQDGTWQSLTDPNSSAFIPNWGALLIGELTFNLSLLAVSIYLIYLFFSKHYLFPRFYIGIVVASLVFIPLDAWLYTQVYDESQMFDPSTIQEFSRIVVNAVIWIPYMLVSKRVKATFTEPAPKLHNAL